MDIKILGAKENNLRNINVTMPLGKIIGITGVSGSGKSTLAKTVLAKYGLKNYALTLPSSSKNFITDYMPIDVDAIDNLPATLLIDVVNSINNPNSTLATVTNIHTLLRKIFTEFGQTRCNHCDAIINNDPFEAMVDFEYKTLIEIKVDDKYNKRLIDLEKIANIDKIIYYDEFNNQTTKKTMHKYCNIYISSYTKNDKQLASKVMQKIGTPLRFQLVDQESTIDSTRETICSHCKQKNLIRTMKLFSFNIDSQDGGGACINCKGSGHLNSFNIEKLIVDPNKSLLQGALSLVNSKGIQYTTITEKFLEAIAKKYDFSLDMPYSQLNNIQKNAILFGTGDEIIKFTDRQGGKNGKKEELYLGVINYLEESYRQGKGKKNLDTYFTIETCNQCRGTRLDKELNNITLFQKTIHDILSMTIDELYNFCEKFIEATEERSLLTYLNELKSMLITFRKVGCGYLTLNRDSRTLSGGELQRLRLSTFISSKISNVCIILDEPTTGLHPNDIYNIIDIIYELKMLENTVIIVEHNKQILEVCDHIVDLGPFGGKDGGKLLFSDSYDNLFKYSTPTTVFLKEEPDYFCEPNKQPIKITKKKQLTIEDVTVNNLKNITANIPLNTLVAICGVSGSGKSSFVNMALIPLVEENPKKYGVSGIESLGQKNAIKSVTSNVGSLLDLNTKIASVFSKTQKELDQSSFMLNSKVGKCKACEGKGYVGVSYEEIGDICDECEGKIFNKEILAVMYKGLNIYELLNMPIKDLRDVFLEEESICTVLDNCIHIGIDYLTLARTSKTLSKGEIQRAKLVNTLSSKKKNYIYVLDEPTRGLHNSDINKLYKFIRKVIDAGNTVLTVEHNLNFIKKSDWVMEFGPKSGKEGGQLIYNGVFNELVRVDTPTANALKGLKESSSPQIKGKDVEISFSIEGEEVSVKKNQINYLKISNEKLDELFNYSNAEYLKILSPATRFLSSNMEVSGQLAIDNLPIIRKLDTKRMFTKGSRIIDTLNVNYEVSKLFISSLEDSQSIPLHVFDINSKVGKCKVCKGNGVVETIDINLIMVDGFINKETEDLLKKRTNYTLAKKHLKKSYNIDITKNYIDMSREEKQIFIYGSRDAVFLEKGKEYYWEGINKLIIKQMSYYKTDTMIAKVKESKEKRLCEVCKGALLGDQYKDITFENLTFKEFLNYKIGDIEELILQNKRIANNYPAIKKLINISKFFRLFDIGELSFNDILDNLTVFQSTIIQYISYRVNNIHDSLLILNGLDWIDTDKHKKTLLDDIKNIQFINTVIIKD